MDSSFAKILTCTAAWNCTRGLLELVVGPGCVHAVSFIALQAIWKGVLTEYVLDKSDDDSFYLYDVVLWSTNNYPVLGTMTGRVT